MAFRIDASASPVVLVVWSAPPDAAQTTAFFDELERIHDEAHARGAKVICIHEITYTGVPGPDVRSILATRAKVLAAHPAALFQIAGLQSAAQRGVVTVVGWFAPGVKGKLKSVADVAEGWQVAKDVLTKNGIAVPAEPAWLTARTTRSVS